MVSNKDLLKVIIVDFDETLVDLNVDWANLREQISDLFKGHGINAQLFPLTSGIEQALCQMPDPDMGRRQVDDLIAVAEYQALSRSSYIEGARELIAALKEKGYYLVVYSANNESVVLAGLAMHAIVVDSVWGKLEGRVSKSDPESHLWIKNQLVDSRIYGVIGDSETDNRLARSLNVNFYHVDKRRLNIDYTEIVERL